MKKQPQSLWSGVVAGVQKAWSIPAFKYAVYAIGAIIVLDLIRRAIW